MLKHQGEVELTEYEGRKVKIKIKLPAGCTGILFVFESKKAAREYWGKDVPLQRVEWTERRTDGN